MKIAGATKVIFLILIFFYLFATDYTILSLKSKKGGLPIEKFYS